MVNSLISNENRRRIMLSTGCGTYVRIGEVYKKEECEKNTVLQTKHFHTGMQSLKYIYFLN